MKQLGPAILVVLFFSETVAAGGGLGGMRGKRSSSSVARSRFPLASSFFHAGRTSGLSSLIFIFIHVWCMRWICWSSLSHGRRLHVSSVDQVAHATRSLAETQDSSSAIHNVPLWSAQLERSTDQKAGHVILSPLGSSSMVVI